MRKDASNEEDLGEDYEGEQATSQGKRHSRSKTQTKNDEELVCSLKSALKEARRLVGLFNYSVQLNEQLSQKQLSQPTPPSISC